MLHNLRRVVLGSPLPTEAEKEQRLTKIQALAVFSSDALSSVAYATEEILLVLVAAGPAAAALSLPISLAVAALLLIVATSYHQTIHGYPSGGGAYIVAHDNLGLWPGLAAGAALLIDYVLTVAVSITAGTAAITSAFPVLLPWRVELALLAIAFVAWANMRGVRESATLFAFPTYGFVAVVFGLIASGALRLLSGDLAAPAGAFPAVSGVAQAVTPFLILRAFASGCTALTGVEAISNGIPAFRRPEARNAGRTLVAMAAILGAMFLGISSLSHALGVLPAEDETVLSQIGRQLFGEGPLYFALQAATALILILAANTSFADFPRLSAILARARFLPRQMTSLGDRLVFANGIAVLAGLASILVVVFGAQTHRLIPLYAVGVFLSFTLSQAGMVRHWYKQRRPHWAWKAAINGIGMLTTGIVLLVMLATKFTHGAWIVALAIPACVLLFLAIRKHYTSVGEQLSLEGLKLERWTKLATQRAYKVVVPISGIHRGTLAALRLARSVSADVAAVIVDVEPEVTAKVQEKWSAWGHGVPLVVLDSPYRSTTGPLLKYLDAVDRRDPERGPAVVVVPEFVPARWWHHALHRQTALLVKTILTYGPAGAGRDRVVISVPYHLQR
jgi:amino acid transporter